MNTVFQHWLGYTLALVIGLHSPLALALGCSDHDRHTVFPVQADMADCASMQKSQGVHGIEHAKPELAVASDSIDSCCTSSCACPAVASIALLASAAPNAGDDHAVLVATTGQFRISIHSKVLIHPPI